MEGLDAKLERVAGDVNELISLYDFAEKLYPYQNIRESTKVSRVQPSYRNIIYIYPNDIILNSSTRTSSAET